MLKTINYNLKHNFTLMQEPHHPNTYLLTSFSVSWKNSTLKVGAGKIFVWFFIFFFKSLNAYSGCIYLIKYIRWPSELQRTAN